MDGVDFDVRMGRCFIGPRGEGGAARTAGCAGSMSNATAGGGAGWSTSPLQTAGGGGAGAASSSTAGGGVPAEI